MSLLGWYVLFAITTGFVTLYELIAPVLRDMVADELDVPVLNNKVLVYVVFFFLATLMAPLYFFICIVPSLSQRFRVAIRQSFVEQ